MKHVFSHVLRLLVPLRLSIDAPGSGGAGAGGGAGDPGAGAGGGGNPNPGQSAPPVTDFRTFLDEKGQFTAPDKVFTGDYAHLAKRFNSFESFAKSYVNAERMISNGNKVPVPSEKSTPEEWEYFYRATGRPDTPEGYGIKMPEKVGEKPFPKELWNEERAKEFAGFAHKLGLTQKQVQALSLWDAERGLGDQEKFSTAKQQEYDSAIAELEKGWGGKDSPQYREQLALAEKGAAAAGLAGDVLKNNPALSNNPHFIRAMAQVGAMIGEKGGAAVRDGAAGNMGQNPQAEINAILADKSHPYWVKGHPGHQQAVEQMQQLYQRKAALTQKT